MRDSSLQNDFEHLRGTPSTGTFVYNAGTAPLASQDGPGGMLSSAPGVFLYFGDIRPGLGRVFRQDGPVYNAFAGQKIFVGLRNSAASVRRCVFAVFRSAFSATFRDYGLLPSTLWSKNAGRIAFLQKQSRTIRKLLSFARQGSAVLALLSSTLGKQFLTHETYEVKV